MATHLLPPPNGTRLLASDIVRRIRDEFDHVDINAEEGQDHVGSMIETFVRLKAPQEIIEWHVNVRESAIQICVSDDPADEYAYVTFTAMDGGDVFIGYSSQQHEDRARPIVERCQAALGYDLLTE